MKFLIILVFICESRRGQWCCRERYNRCSSCCRGADGGKARDCPKDLPQLTACGFSSLLTSSCSLFTLPLPYSVFRISHSNADLARWCHPRSRSSLRDRHRLPPQCPPVSLTRCVNVGQQSRSFGQLPCLCPLLYSLNPVPGPG
ncbi:uncharacterized protein BDW70DRAFT_84664 [Aspergillus foveolatus]|uniref:uncharacterized protein n=1 Tax=Aspergillus foveolatus TaxID=210207 RepID=UPI003CCD84A1